MRIESASLIELLLVPQPPRLLVPQHVIYLLPKLGTISLPTASCLTQVSYACPRREITHCSKYAKRMQISKGLLDGAHKNISD